MAKKYVRENVPLSRFGVLVAQLESIVASAAQQPPESILCFDLLSDLISAIDEEPKESILLWQRKCEDALYSLLILGARRPVRHLASLAMARIISKGDGISIYSRASSLQGLLSDGKRSEPLRAAGAAQCLGELYRHFGRRITSGLLETTNIAAKLMKFNEDFVRQEALEMLQNALEGSGGSGASAAYTEAFRLIMRIGVGDKSFIVKIAAARCLKTFASIGGPGLGVTELENSASYCVKALEDPTSSVRDAFAEALGALLALGMNPEAQVQPRGKGQSNPARKLEGCLQKHLTGPFMRANGVRFKDIRIGLTLSWIFFLQAIRLKYLHPDSELPEFAFQVMDMLRGDSTVDAHALACVLYILRVGVTDQMTESTQRSFLVLLGRQLESPDISPSMEVAALHTLSYTLTTLGEVPSEFKEILDNTIFAALSHSEALVRIEAALTLRALAEVDPTCVGGLISYAVTTLTALRESISFEKGSKLKVEVDSLLGQATVLAALVSISPKLPLGYPAKLPKSVLDVSKKMLTEYNRNPVAATAENEAGWLLVASLIASMPKEELEDQVFDILALWATPFSGNDEYSTKQNEDLASELRVWSAAVDALTAFIRCFISPTVAASNNGILLQPVLLYLGRALSYISALTLKQQPSVKSALDLFSIRTLIAYQSLPDPMAYRSDHSQIIQICTTPFRDPSSCEESSCLRLLLDKRDVWLGPWIPGRDWFEDELRAFQGGKDGLLPCVWENEHSTFPQPETIGKMLVNQMLLCFGILFATQDSTGMLSLLGMIEQCLKAKKQSWHSAAVTNACVGLLSGLKVLLALRPQPLGVEILSSAHGIFQGILGEGDICAAQRRASSEGLGLLARLGNDIFTARMTRGLLGDLVASSDLSYTASIALSLGCIHRSAGGMALSTLVPTTVSSISSLAKSSNAGLKIWSLHGLLLTIEAAGLTYVSQVQATLLLAMEILLTEENGWVDLRQGIGRLINAIVAVLGPELAPGSIFFSRCKSVVAEISSGQATATLLESVRFTQQLVLFAPQAVSMHSHVQTLLPTLSSRQPVLRHLAVSTLRHLIEKDPVAIIDEKIEENLFEMFDEEPDSEIGNLVRNTITSLLYTSCPSRPSHWISICRNMVLAVPTRRNAFGNSARSEHEPGLDGDGRLYHGEDDENMVSSAPGRQGSPAEVSSLDKRDNHLRYRTRVFAAECLSHVPAAVGKNPAHFDLSLARQLSANGLAAGDWLILQIQELIALAYQISTMQFENMQPIGVELLSTILDKFEKVPDPDLPGHFLMEQYQAQLVSAIRTALNTSSGPLLLEAGLHLATKILTSSITSGDQVAVKRIFSLISRPLSDFKDLYYPSFAEWVACKIKVRLLAAHASVKCYTYAFLRRQHCEVRDEYLALVPQFSKASNILGKSWMSILKDYCYACFGLQSNKNYRPFLDGIQSPLVLSKLQPCLEDAWPVILQAITLDGVPVKLERGDSSKATDEDSGKSTLISGCRMVELDSKEFCFLWGFALLVLFQEQHPVTSTPLLRANAKSYTESRLEETRDQSPKFYEIGMLVLNSLSTERFFSAGFLTLDICRELLQVFAYAFHLEDSWKGLVVPVLSQIVQVSPESFFETEDFVSMALELCVMHLNKIFRSTDTVIQDHPSCTDLVSALVVAAETLIYRSKPQMQLNLVLACLVTSYNCLRGASTESCLSKVVEFVHSIGTSLKKHIEDKAKLDDADLSHLKTVLEAWLNLITTLIQDCIKGMYLVENRKSNLCRLLQRKLAFCLEQAYSIAKLAHETRHLGKNDDNNEILFTVYRHSTKFIHTTLTHSNMQVQTVGLQVLKGMAQKELGEGSNIENHYFFMFFIGELFGDIFNLVQNMLKKPMNQESVAITSECLRLLVLLQALSKVAKCQKGLINLFLEAVIMVVSAPTNDSSQEMIEIRSIALKLVSHLAQLPSSAVHFKDVLLTMPVTHRQQLQDIIRASVTMDTKPTQTKVTTSPLTIKLPVQLEQSTKVESKVQDSASSPMHYEDTMEEEDDWDAFQSFNTADDTAGANSQADQIAVEPELAAHPSVSEVKFDNNDEFEEFSSSQILNDKGSPDPQFEEVGEEKASQVKIDDEFHEYTNSVALKEVEGANDVELEEGGGEKVNQLKTNDNFQEYSNSPPLKDLKETRDPQLHEGDGEKATLTKEGERDDNFRESHLKDVEEIHDAELEIGGGEKTMVANPSEREDGFEESSLNDVKQIDESLLHEVAVGKEILVNEGERDYGSGSSDLQPFEIVTKPSDDHLDGCGDAEKNQENDDTEMNQESDVKAYPSHEILEETKLSKDSFGEDHEGTISRNQASEVDLLAALDPKPLESAQDSSIDLHVEVDGKESLMGKLDIVSGLDAGHAEGHDDTEMNQENDVKAYPSHETLEEKELSNNSFGEDCEGTISTNQASEVDLLASLDPKPLEAAQDSSIDLHVEVDGKESLMGDLDNVSGLDAGHAEIPGEQHIEGTEDTGEKLSTEKEHINQLEEAFLSSGTPTSQDGGDLKTRSAKSED